MTIYTPLPLSLDDWVDIPPIIIVIMSTYETFLSLVDDLSNFGLSFEQAASEILPSFSEEEQQEILRAHEESEREYEEYVESLRMPVVPIDIPY